MECTQRLECTQDLCESQLEKTYPDQIGVLGICGKTYPVKKGPNKIGRDPQTCNIVLDLTSVSRQHAVINILNSTEFMIMDLDSANKTKLLNKTLPPYIPHVLKHGDTVQFGQVFGVFRLINDNSDLPMTQALDIPDTPVVNKYASKYCNVPSTIIPESPNISDKDESFIATPQSKDMRIFKNTNSNFMKFSEKTDASQSVGTNKIDNVIWSSSKKSVSIDMDLDGSIESTNNLSYLKSLETEENLNIHEMETQVPITAITNGYDSIYTANTQMSTNDPVHSGISNIEKNNLPDVLNINKQLEMKLDVFVENKENNNSIHNADKEQLRKSNDDGPRRESLKDSFAEMPKTNHNISDEEILFEEVDTQPFGEDLGSQPLVYPESLINEAINTNLEKRDPKPPETLNDEKTASRKTTRVNSNSSTDCEDFDMLLTQKILVNPEDESKCRKSVPDNYIVNQEKCNPSTTSNLNDDSTDCEDNVTENKDDKKFSNTLKPDDDDSTDCEDDLVCIKSVNQIVEKLDNHRPGKYVRQNILADNINMEENLKDHTTDLEFEEMLTQVIEEVDLQKDMCTSEKSKQTDFENLDTQIIQEVTLEEKTFEQSKSSTEISPFKVPMQSAKNFKRREITNNPQKTSIEEKVSDCVKCDDNFYTATQEIINDLCSQREVSVKTNKLAIEDSDKLFTVNKLYETSCGENKSDELIKKTTNQQMKDGFSSVEVQTKRKVISSDSSDVECTPKKIRPLTFMETELPNSQEIKKSVRLNPRTLVTESSSDSGPDNYLEEQYTPIVHHKHIKCTNTNTSLTKKSLLNQLPTKVITRVRKPTTKVLNSSLRNKNFLLSRFVTELEENIDTDIITENISRLKSKKKKVDVGSKEDKNNEEQKLVKIDPNDNNKLELSLNLSERLISRKDAEIKNNSQRKNVKKTNVKKTVKVGNDDNKSLITEYDNQKSLRLETDKSQTEMQKNKLFEERENSSSHTLEKSSRMKTKNQCEDQSLGRKTAKTSIVNNNAKESLTSLLTTQRSSRSKRKDVVSTHETKDEVKLSDKKDKKCNHRDDNRAPSPEKELRRSKRQRIVKQSEETITDGNLKKPSSKKKPDEYISLKSHKKTNDSTVFSISSGSGTESPKHKSFETPGRSNTNLDVKKKMTTTGSVHHMSTRITPRQANSEFVLFTAFPSEEVKSKLEKLGAVIVTDVKACTVLLTLEIKRTFKLLCAVGLGRPIVGPSWVQACVDTKMIVDPWQYLIRDDAKEKRFQFNLQRTLTGNRNFLKGYNVSSTPSVMPAALEMKLIVECSGGIWKEGGSKWLCVSSSADKALWPSLKRRGAVIVNTELILGGALRQKLDIERNKLA